MLGTISLRILFAGISIAAALAVPLLSFAACAGDDPNCVKAFAGFAGLSTGGSLAEVLGSVVRAIIALLGVVFFGLLIFAGIKWMTARGNQEITDDARRTIESAAIGLIVVLISYAFASYVIERIFT